MKTVFDAVTLLNEAGEDSKRAQAGFAHLLDSEDFETRHGKRVYVNWIERACNDGMLNQLAIDLVGASSTLMSSSDRGSRVLMLASDFMKRKRILTFVTRCLVIFVQEFVTDSKPIASTVFDLLSGFAALDKAGSQSIDRRGLAVCLMRLGVAYPYLRHKDSRDGVLKYIIQCAKILDTLPRQWRSILGALLFEDGLKLALGYSSDATQEESEISVDEIKSCVPYSVQISLRIAHQAGARSSAASPMDLFFAAQLVIHEPTFPVQVLVEAARGTLTSAFDELLVYYGMTCDLLFGTRRAQACARMLITGLTDPKNAEFFVSSLKYLILQLRQGFKKEDHDRIREQLIEQAKSLRKHEELRHLGHKIIDDFLAIPKRR